MCGRRVQPDVGPDGSYPIALSVPGQVLAHVGSDSSPHQVLLTPAA